MSSIRKLSFAVAIGVLSGVILSAAADRALAARDVTDTQLADAIRMLAEQSQTRARSIEDLAPATGARRPKTSQSADHDPVPDASTARDVEHRLRSIAAYSAQIERSLQGIDKAMSTVPVIQKRVDRVRAVVDP